MNEIICVVGIDVAKRKFDIALLINNKIKTKVFDNTPAGHKAFEDWLIERSTIPGQAHLCMEATEPYSEVLATRLVTDGWPVSVVNPARIKGFAPQFMDSATIEWRELRGSIPGIGDTTVAKVLAYAGNIRRFTNAKALA